MRSRRRQTVVSLLILLLYMVTLACALDACITAMNANQLTASSWTKCYQDSSGNILGYNQPDFHSGYTFNGAGVNWDKDYKNNIAFMATTTTKTQYWDYNYHNSDTCGYWGYNGDHCDCTNYYCYYRAQYPDHDGNGNTYYVRYRHYDNYADSSVTTTLYLPCHWYCASCTSSWDNTQCPTCSASTVNAYRWLNWGSTSSYTNKCQTYCPNDDNYHGNTNSVIGQYISSTTNRQCSRCSSLCSVCNTYGGGASQCTVCMSSASLYQSNALCQSTFTSGTDKNYCKANYICTNTCQRQLYFKITRSQTTDPKYTFFTSTSANLQLTNVCFLCHQLCLVCTDLYSTTCSVCASNAALYQSYSTCRATFLYGNDKDNCKADNQCETSCQRYLYFWLPKSLTTSASYPFTANGASNLQEGNVCYLCNSLCLVCTDSLSTTCQVCATNAALYQSKSTCLSTFQYGSDNTHCKNDDICETTCQRYLYFWIDKSLTSDPKYSFTANGPPNLREGNVCYLCHSLCLVCTDSLSTTCQVCATNAALYQSKATCIATFTHGTDSSNCKNDDICETSCQRYLYFWLDKSKTSLGNYSFTATGASNLREGNVCYLCHSYCLVCTDSVSTTCQVCATNAALYQSKATCLSTFQYGSDNTYCKNDDICETSCQRYLYFWISKSLTSDAKYSFTATGAANLREGNVCYLCHSLCMVCTDLYQTTCSVCATNAALLQSKSLCLSTFSATDEVNCKQDNQCVTSCPTNLYFWLNKASTGVAAYDFTATGPSNLREGNVCYLCHKYCFTCSDQYEYTCTSCAQSYYLWQQYTTRCSYFCNEGGSYTAGSTLGEYVIATTNRQCGTCTTGCKFCAVASTQCYICQDSHYLVDDRATCLARFTCKQCVNPGVVTDGCQSRDKYCRTSNTSFPSNCPAFFYFRVNRTTNWGIHDDPTNNLYKYFTQASSVDTSLNGYETGTTRSSNTTWQSPQGSNPTYYYRKYTNLCVLCDYRCMKCFGPTNLNCTVCVNNFYKWTTATVCSNICPLGQFQQNISAPYPDNETMCANCDVRCIACVGYNNNCSSCTLFPSTNYAFLYTFFTSNATCMAVCPVSTNNLTTKGFYGSIGRMSSLSNPTMICQSCPGGCSNCNIDQVLNITGFPQLRPVICDTDNYCLKGIQCTSCLTGYSLVAGQCVGQTTCRLYSYYLKGANSTSAWSPTNCVCLNGYYMSATITCSACHIRCATCNGPNSNNCLSCSQGYSLLASKCLSTNTGSQVKAQVLWDSYLGFNSSILTGQPTQKKFCKDYYTLFGYLSSVSTSSYYQYSTTTIATPNYYGIYFRMKILFIDNWDTNAGIYFKLNSNPNPSVIYAYNNYGAIGEQKCGTNANDYLMTVQGKILFTPVANDINTITVYPNVNPVSNASGFYYYWGIHSALFTVLQCHPDCSTCTGPDANQCTACSSNTKRVVNGSCVCNSSANYYYVQGSTTTCQLGCAPCNSTVDPTLCYYRDAQTATCVNPPTKNCTAPYVYADFYNITDSYGTCVKNCSTGMYVIPSQLKCTNACYNFGLFFYKGAATLGVSMWTCVSVCPSGLILDLTTVSCVTECPYYSGNTTRYFFQLQNRTSNPICVSNCTTGYQYDLDNACVASCPSGYYTQTLNAHNKCVLKCTNSMYGDNLTASCVEFCPTPSIADPTTNLCINQCPLGYYFQVFQGNGSRFCVVKCESGQWLHPYYLNCSKNPMDCPDGTFAQNSTQSCVAQCAVSGQVGQNTTRMCQTSCNTGFAFWEVGLCVKVCNNSMWGFKNSSKSECVYNCYSNESAMYADEQAQRTCVKNCSASPISTFGDNVTGSCVKQCTVNNQYGDAYHPYRLCVTVCTSTPNQTYSYYLTKLCLATCPTSYYGDNYTTTGVGVCSTTCPNGYYANPLNNLCVSICPFRYYGSPINGRPCVQTCPEGYYSINLTSNRVCTTICDYGYWADNYTRACTNVKTNCNNNTFADVQKKLCVTGTNCTVGTYADPLTSGCESKCTNSTYFGDPSTNLCVTLCPTTPDYYSQNGICNATCTGGYFADYVANRTCLVNCSSSPVALYGTSAFRCVVAKLCGVGLFGNNNTRLCSACSGTLPFGDPISYQCVIVCPFTYYGDPTTNLCVQQCNFSKLMFADNKTGNCTTVCSLGTFGANDTSAPVCLANCPANSYAYDPTRICVQNCTSGYFGDPLTGKCFNSSLNCSDGYYGNSLTNMCVLPIYCQTISIHYYADNATKMCIPKCSTPNFGLNTTWYCVAKCPEPLFSESSSNMCVVSSSCQLFNYLFADDQINACVRNCSTTPVFTFAQNITYTCVIPEKCPIDNGTVMLAQNTTQSCVYHCPHTNTTYSYADPFKSIRCVQTCPDKYYGEISSGRGLCASVCPGVNYFRDNSTQTCVYTCPAANLTKGTPDTYGDNTTDTCVTKCPDGYFAQESINRTCVPVCSAGTWGNPVTRMCVTNPASCPSNTWGDNFTNLCTSLCSSNSSNNQLLYGDNTTRLCVTSCPSPSFAFIQTRVCIDMCPVTIGNTPGFFGDPSTSPTRLCVTACLTSGLYRDVANNRTCQSTCTFTSIYKTYRDPTTMTCVAECPSYPQNLYAWGSNSTTAACVFPCPTGYMNDANRSCVVSCPNLLDPTTNTCVFICPYNSALNTTLYANLLTKTCVAASSCPNNTYASDDLLTCVSTCPNNTYIDQKNCVYTCPFGYYINYATQTCVKAISCPTGYFANNQTSSCVSACSNGTFGDSSTRMCITQCYGNKFADPITGVCNTTCSSGLIMNSLTFSCVGNCQTGYFYNPLTSSCTTSCQSPYFADSKVLSCVLVCSSDPMTFASTTPSRECVTTCPSSLQWFDTVNRVCNSSCPTNTYKYSVNTSCVAFCPSPYFLQSSQSTCVLNCTQNGATGLYADPTTQTCVQNCSSGFFRDPTTFRCVISCPVNPLRYYYETTSKNCVTSCSSFSLFADNQKGGCVSQCSKVPLTFADPSSSRCVQSCPVSNSSFADPTTQKCVSRCPTGYFADIRQRSCLSSCGNIYFADLQTNPPACVSFCTSGTFADPLLFRCVTNCSASYFSFSPNSTCLQFCPYGYFADNWTKSCITQCTYSPDLYADNLTHACSQSCSNGQFAYKAPTNAYGVCVFICPPGTFSNPLNMSCVTKCPDGYFGSTKNNTCNMGCEQGLFMDSVNNLCQSVCPANDALFGQPFSRRCVSACNSTGYSFMFADSLTRLCATTCSGIQFADNSTMKCVTNTSCPSGSYADSYYKQCVTKCYNQTFSYQGICYSQCPSTTLFANLETQSCVNATDCASGLFGDPSKRRCVLYCDIASNAYADLASRTCLANCSSPLFADNITRTCASVCTSIPMYYGNNDTRVCVQYCPVGTYGDPTINLCVEKCANGSYGDNSTWTCGLTCPNGTFADNSTNTCVFTCPSAMNYFGDVFKGACVYNCSNGLYADAAHNRECQKTCLNGTFSQNSTMTCVSACLTGYADIRTGRCIAICTKGYYGYKFVCYPFQCPTATTMVYADDNTNLCVTKCPNGTFGQISTRKCVTVCPIASNQFADLINNVCVTSCNTSFFADPSTRNCVSTCPSIPSLFGQNGSCVPDCPGGLFANNATRTCVSSCPNGTFADNTTNTCAYYCPSKPLMLFADSFNNTCVVICPIDRYADNGTRSCVTNCPNGTYADSTTRSCRPVCSAGFFGVNTTLRCQSKCPNASFADNLTRLCVKQCPINPVSYGHSVNNTCLSVCPANSYGNPLTQQCVYNNLTVSSCPPSYFANPVNQLCVQVCPMKQDLYAEPNTKTCKSSCVSPYIADNSTMRCVLVCPSYPSYFASLNNSNSRCVKYCPANTYADNSSRVCVLTCPNGTYAENSTWRCVSFCLNKPMALRDPLNWKCVTVCPPSYFEDPINLICVQVCPENTFARNDTRQCVKVCPVGTYSFVPTRTCIAKCFNSTYADNSSWTCVLVCPRSPPLYAYDTNMTCIPYCPVGMFSFDDTRQCVSDCPSLDYYRQNSTNSCVTSCNVNETTFTDNVTRYCVSRCSNGSYADPTTKRCVSICPDRPLLYSQNTTQSCLTECPGSLYGENKTRSCVTNCPNGSLSYPDKHLCVFVCPTGYYAYLVTQFCYTTCPAPYYGDPSTRSCVLECPINQLLYSDNKTRTCVKTCPSGSYAYQWAVSCLPSCPIAVAPYVQTYAADYDNTCVVECAYPYYSYDATYQCITSCPTPYYNDLPTHKCLLCPSACSACTKLSACTSCNSGFFLQNGECVTNCSYIYYANSLTRACVVSNLCSPNFGQNSTKICKSSCEVGSYKNYNAYRCDACPQTCTSCISLTNCLSCISTSVSFDNFCYGYCNITNATQMYFNSDNKTCTATCPNGTYPSVVFCKLCSSQCSSCSLSPTNCTNCSNGLYLLNFGCVTQCPDKYKPNINRECIFCNTTCGAGLTYTTNATQINGQTSLFMTFSSTVSIKNPYDTIKVNTGGRLLQTSSSSLGYQIVVVGPNTVQIVFPPGASTTDYNIQITNPQNIVDANGNIPNSVAAQVQITGNSQYSTSLSQTPNDFPLYFTFLSIICIITFIFDIELMRFLQIIYVHYFIVLNLPPLMVKSFAGLRYSTLYYLPSFFKVASPVLRPNIPSYIYDSVGDYNFLRNAGFAFTPLTVILFVWALLKLLSVPQINRFKDSRVWCSRMLQQKFKYAVLLQWVGLFIMNTVFFAFLQLRDYSIYDDLTQVSLILAHVVIVLFFIMVILVAYRVVNFYHQYPTLSENMKKAADIILQDDEADQLVSTNVFLSEKKKIDMRNVYYPKINNQNIFPFKCFYRYNFLSLICPNVIFLRAILLSAFIGLAKENAVLQMALCIPLNVLTLLYFSKARPYTFKFKHYRIKNYFVIYHQICIIILEFLLLVLAMKERNNATAAEKQQFCKNIIYFITAACTITFLYHIFVFVVFLHRKVWLIFIESQIFKRNFPQKYAEIQAAKMKNKKLVRSIDPKAKEALKNMIKGYKKSKSTLRPSDSEKVNSQLPVKYKITYFDRSQTSSATSRTTLTKTQKKKMLKEIFNDNEVRELDEKDNQYEEIKEKSELDLQYEEYEQQIEIKAKDLSKYVSNAENILKAKRDVEL